VALSPAGEGLVGYARRILHLGDEAVQRLRQHDIAGRVRFGVMDDYGTRLLPPILKSFCAAYPGVELQMETGLTGSMIGRLGKAFDIVLAMHPRGENDGELLRRDEAVWAASSAIAPRDLDPLPLALYPQGCLFREWATEALDRIRRKWRLAFVSHSLAAVEAFTAQGLAVTVVKASTRSKSLQVLDAEAGLPRLPTADIRMHVASSGAIPVDLLAQHLREHIGTSGMRNNPARSHAKRTRTG
jgi:DNA-binding transcriptional LysR family regulator